MSASYVKDVHYNSDLEQQLLNSLKVREEQSAAKSVRFDASVHGVEKPSRKHQRDSQRTRESPGHPGSRRHNRHQNKMQLLDKALSDSESELEIEVELTITYKSGFKELFSDMECKKRWEPFIEITEEEERRLLRLLCDEHQEDTSRPARKTKKHAFPTDPEECFKLLNSEEKRIMKRQSGNPLIEKIESRLINFILSRKSTMDLLFTSEQRFERILFNCCCVYYSVRVEGYWLDDGSISETIRKPKGVQIPSMKMSNYLKTLPQQ